MTSSTETRDTGLAALADRLFALLRERDFEAAATCFAPGATWWISGGLRGAVPDVLRHLARTPSAVGPHTHEETRRLYGADGFVEQHVARWRDRGGDGRELAVCAVVRVGADGLVTRFEEYVDTAALAPSAQTVIGRVAEHVLSEYDNRVPEIVATISEWDVHYALLSRARAGLVLEEVHDRDGAARYYDATRDAYQVVTSHHLKEVNTTWYSFHESMGQVTHVGMMEDVPPTGRDLYVPTAVLFPVWPDGIIGEIVWTRFDMAEIARGNTGLGPPPAAAEPYLPAAQMRNSRLHDEFVRGWREGDVDGILTLLAADSCSVVRTAEIDGDRRTRTVARGRDEHRRHLVSPDGLRPRSLQVTNLVVADWYIFAEYLLGLDVEGRPVERRMASLYPVTEEGRLVGQLAYALDARA